MGQIKVEKNAGGIQGLCVIEPTVHGDARDALWRHITRKIWRKPDLQCSLFRTISHAQQKEF